MRLYRLLTNSIRITAVTRVRTPSEGSWDAWRDARFGTRAIHAGQEPDPTTGAVIPPLYLTSTYVQPGVGDHLGYEYTRTDNPTRRGLEVQLAALEGALKEDA